VVAPLLPLLPLEPSPPSSPLAPTLPPALLVEPVPLLPLSLADPELLARDSKLPPSYLAGWPPAGPGPHAQSGHHAPSASKDVTVMRERGRLFGFIWFSPFARIVGRSRSM